MTWVDYAIIGIFLSGLALAGLTLSKLIRHSDDIFVAGRQLTPFILGATITATNLSMFHFISMGGIAFQKGISIIWQNWTGNMALVLSGLFVIPIMRRLRVRSIPEFLEIRYSRSLRVLVGAFWGIRLCIFLGIFLYVATTTGIQITGWNNPWGWLMVFSLIAIMYSAIGGAWAVAIMDSLQFALIILGGLITLPIAVHLAGGTPTLINWLQTHGKPVHVQLVPAGAGEFNWLFILAILLISTKWATVDQVILQRALGARNPRIGAQGMVLSGLITTPLAFLWILPGVALAKIHPGPIENPDHAIPWFLATYLPQVGRGILGLVLCGLVAAQVSTITADINSVATLFTNDVFRAMKRKEPSQRQLIYAARFSSLVCGALMLWVAYYLLMHSVSGAVRANLTVVGIVDLPLFVITVIWGLMWKRTTWQGAMAGFFIGGLAGILTYLVVTPTYFHNILYPLMSAIPGKVDVWAVGWHERLKHLEPALRNIAPFVSSGTALIVTPIVSLLTKPVQSEGSVRIWTYFRKSADDEKDIFLLIPNSFRGKIGLSLVIVGFLAFLFGAISASWGFSLATVMAVGGMCVLFVGGVLRVWSE
ncbi:MAG: sodium:solute symporter family protein [Armatimonadota bacterium]|nr:sodium:solute symporter family protein [Armatimonadota bacterium]